MIYDLTEYLGQFAQVTSDILEVAKRHEKPMDISTDSSIILLDMMTLENKTIELNKLRVKTYEVIDNEKDLNDFDYSCSVLHTILNKLSKHFSKNYMTALMQ